MPFYSYTALNNAGKQVRSRVEASSIETAKASLRSTGYVILDIRQQANYNVEIELPFLGKPRSKDLALFCRQFASILRSGVPMSGALEMMGQQTQNRKLRTAVKEMQGDVAKGVTLAEAMRRHTGVFPRLLVSMADAGEQSGNLEAVFFQMEGYFDKAAKTGNAVRGALMYPAILGVVMVVAVIFMMVRVIPMFMETFTQLDIELPKLTQIVIAVSRWMGRYWWAVFLGMIALVVGGRVFHGTSTGKHFFGLLARKIPVIRDLTNKSACAMFCRTQSLLQSSGMDITEALNLTAENVGNIWYREAVEDTLSMVMRGILMATALRDTKLFPPMVYNMVQVGEESGDLIGMLDKTALYYDDEVAQETARLLALVQPAMIIFLAGFVVVIVLSILLPIISMTQAYDKYL